MRQEARSVREHEAGSRRRRPASATSSSRARMIASVEVHCSANTKNTSSDADGRGREDGRRRCRGSTSRSQRLAKRALFVAGRVDLGEGRDDDLAGGQARDQTDADLPVEAQGRDDGLDGVAERDRRRCARARRPRPPASSRSRRRLDPWKGEQTQSSIEATRMIVPARRRNAQALSPHLREPERSVGQR